MSTNPEADYAAFLQRRPRLDAGARRGRQPGARTTRRWRQQSRQYNELTTFWVQINNAQAAAEQRQRAARAGQGHRPHGAVRDMASGIGVPTTSIIPPACPAFRTASGQELGFDPRRRGALLAQAGFPSGQGLPNLAFSFAATRANQRRAEYLQDQWQQNLGIDVQLNPMDPEAYQQALEDKNYDLAFGGWARGLSRPAGLVQPALRLQGRHQHVSTTAIRRSTSSWPAPTPRQT